MTPFQPALRHARSVAPILACGLALLLGPVSPARADYHLATTVKIGGSGGWDYLEPDPESRRLFVTHQDRVVVVDMDQLKVVGEIPDSPGLGGVALSRDLNRGFTANGAENKVGVFELDTLKPLGKWKATGATPNQIAYEPVTQRVFSFNSTGRNVTVFDAKSGRVLSTIKVDGRTEFYAVDGKGMIYDALLDKSTVIAIDARTMKVVATYPLAPYAEPTSMTMDPETRRLFVSTRGKALLVMDADTGKIIAHFPIGNGTDAVKFDPGTRLIFASSGDGTLTVVREDGKDQFSPVKTVTTEMGARTMAVDTRTHRVFLPSGDFGPPMSVTSPTKRTWRPVVDGSFRLLVLEP